MERRGDRSKPYFLRTLDHRLVPSQNLDDIHLQSGDIHSSKVRHSMPGLRRRAQVQKGVCGVNVRLKTPKRRRGNVEWKRKSVVEEKKVEVYSREKSFSPTSVVIKTNPLFRVSAMPQQIPSNIKGELQLNVHQQRYIAKTKEEEIVNAIIDLAKYGERKFGKKAKRKSLFPKTKSAIARHQRSKSVERIESLGKKHRGSAARTKTPPSYECLY